MSDLDNAIQAINTAADRTEGTTEFIDNLSTYDENSSVTNPNNGVTVPSIAKQVKTRTDELFEGAESDINQSVADAAKSVSDAEASALSLGYQGLWPDTGGSALKGDTYQTQAGGTPTGQYFTALQDTTVDPVGDDVNWREVVSVDSFSQYTDIVYKASGGNSAIENMIAGIPVSLNAGDQSKTGLTSWEGKTSAPGILLDSGLYARPKGFSFVSDWGKPDGSDFTSAFIQANDLGLPLILTDGTYGVYDVDVNVSMYAFGKVTIKSLWDDALNIQKGFKVKNANNTVIDGVSFDGNVSDDPAAWDASNYDSFTGSIPLQVITSTDVTVINCDFNNANWSGFKGDTCVNLNLYSCKSNRTRGNFGDGFYIRECTGGGAVLCKAYDHTRIGFVNEAGCFDFKFSLCEAEYGHDQSGSYGGTEWNRGFWSENSSDCSHSLCTSRNQWSGGFTCTTTMSLLPPNRESFSYSLSNCNSYDVVLPSGKAGGAEAGFRMASLGGIGSKFSLVGCNSYNSEQAFNSVGQRPDDTYNYTNCYGEVRGLSDSSCVFFNDSGSDQTNDSVITATDCSGRFIDATNKYDTSKQAADFGGFSGNKNRLNIVGYTNKDDGVCSVKNLGKPNSKLSIEGRFKDEKYWLYLNSEGLDTTLRNIAIDGPSFNKAGKADSTGIAELKINGITLNQELRVTDSKVYGLGNSIDEGRLRHDIINYPVPAGNLFNVGIDIDFDVSSEVSGLDAPIVLRYIAGSPPPIVSGVWKNTGGEATGNKGFVVFGVSQVTVYANGVISDDSVEFQVADDFGTPTPYNFTAGSQILPM